ncbi:LPS export ABC transporter periplasmic protein LptC [bacterium]|nr:LPS export ABC transporter periplasmic protein LptC [bacterium]MBU1072740.1 LPS export ABC transporter periplasmic protein LptC [bacterium]MBU1674752.1 LPS export ABC transporter periplasmic protein LptC [bacterium]
MTHIIDMLFSTPLRPAALAAALILCVGLAGCTDNERVAATGELSADLPDQELFNTTIYDSKEGMRRWILQSDRLARYNDQDEAQLFGVHMDFYRANGLFSTLTSLRGRANLKTNDLFAWGEVVVVTRDGRRLETEELDYDDATGLISNEVFNRFTRGDNVMTGIGMEATPELDRFELKQSVEATIFDEEPVTGEIDRE